LKAYDDFFFFILYGNSLMYLDLFQMWFFPVYHDESRKHILLQRVGVIIIKIIVLGVVVAYAHLLILYSEKIVFRVIIMRTVHSYKSAFIIFHRLFAFFMDCPYYNYSLPHITITIEKRRPLLYLLRHKTIGSIWVL
jgi:hypothetical protein